MKKTLWITFLSALFVVIIFSVPDSQAKELGNSTPTAIESISNSEIGGMSIAARPVYAKCSVLCSIPGIGEVIKTGRLLCGRDRAVNDARAVCRAAGGVVTGFPPRPCIYSGWC